MNKLFLIISLTLINYCLLAQTNKIANLSGTRKNTVIFKMKEVNQTKAASDNNGDTKLNKLLKDINTTLFEKIYPRSSAPQTKYNSKGQKLVDLSLIYTIEYNSNITVSNVINRLLAIGTIEYAEPSYISEPLYVPNDPNISSLYYLNFIKAFEAWDIDKGDTNIVIGVVDTGVDLEHPDLKPNIKYNYKDPIDGIDNDNDGYVDNFRGWSIFEKNNYPQSTADISYHGCFVAGIASAKADNNEGMAGTGFNCKFLPVKISVGKDMYDPYQGVVYAVDHGCSIINCSWGNKGAGSAYEQDIVNYATYNKNAVLVAAAGNEPYETPYFPASYKNVLSVTASEQHDYKKAISSYGIHVDITAPGEGIYTTVNGGYSTSGGTSMASPLAAGCAAIVKHHFPNYDPIQIAEQIKVTTDYTDTIPYNKVFKNRIGYGRINLLKALTIDSLPSIVLVSDSITDNKFNLLSAEDTVFVYANFINYLHAANKVSCTLRSGSPYISVLDSVFDLNNIETYKTKNNYLSPFKIKILKGAPLNVLALLRIDYSKAGYRGYDWFEIMINRNWTDIKTANINLSITDKGRLGYNDYARQQGNGFSYKNNPLLFCGGLMLGTAVDKVEDAIYATVQGNIDNDFKTIDFTANSTDGTSDKDVNCVLNDSVLNLNIKFNAYSYNNPLDNKYVILEYKVKNNNVDTLRNFYLGLFNDFDLDVSGNNSAEFDAQNKIGYTYSEDVPLYAGIKYLSDVKTNFFAFSPDGVEGNIKISDGFSKAEKYFTLSNSNPIVWVNEISQTTSYGPVKIAPAESVTLAFAAIGGESLADIQQSAEASQLKYNSIISQKDFTVDGYVYYENATKNKPLANIKLQIKTESGSLIAETTTAQNGYYKFNNVPKGIVTLEASTDFEPGGSDPGDALMVNRFYIGAVEINDNIRMIAADVNADKEINPGDALSINRKYIGAINNFPAGNWFFLKESFNLQRNKTINIIGICYGDVNGDY